MSRVLIVGSHREQDEGRERFAEICEEIGYQLASAGHQLAVCSPSAECADPHVVAGANRAGTADQPARVTHFLSSEDLEALDGADAYPSERHPTLDLNTVITHEGWFSTYDLAVENCDILRFLRGHGWQPGPPMPCACHGRGSIWTGVGVADGETATSKALSSMLG